MARQRSNFPVLAPNYGLYYDRPSILVPGQGLEDGLNFRIKNGRLLRENMGWTKFMARQFDSPITLIDSFFPTGGGEILIIGTLTDLYEYDGTSDVEYLTPRYETGTVDVTNGDATVTGTGTAWLTNVKIGDKLHVGADAQRDPDAAWVTVLSITDDTHLELTANWAGSTLTTQDYTIRKVFTAQDLDEFWTSEMFPLADPGAVDLWFATNGVDFPVTWDGAADQVTDRSALGFKAKFLVRWQNMMIYLNITETGGDTLPTTMVNSVPGTPLDVSTAPASQLRVYGGPEEILAAYPLGDMLVVYTQRSITLVQFVDLPVLFIFRTAFSGVGPLAGRGVADLGDYHEFIGGDTSYRFDGASLQEVNQHIWRETIRRRSPQRVKQIQAFFNEEQGELYWVFPLNTDADTDTGPPERAYVQHYLESMPTGVPAPFSLRELPATAAGYYTRSSTLRWDDISDMWNQLNFRWNDQFFQAAFPLTLFGTVDGYVMQLDGADSHDGDAITSFVRFGRFPGSDVVHKGILRRIYVFAERYAGTNHDLTVRVYTADQLAGPVTLAATLTYDLSHAGLRYVTPRVSGRFFQIEFGTADVSAPWQLQGYDVDTVPAGDR